ncbi:hypothetical protein RJ55_07132 [Drechmeria coniospora]|nr:hypothetical protein RJ55_07132 [Drechmeria coniospora]
MLPKEGIPKPIRGFQSVLERDVYHIVRKLEAGNDDKPFKSVTVVYDAIKRSNSSLGRQKKRPLEDAIDRVLQIRKQERQQDQSDDSEAAIDEFEPTNPGDDRFLLNRQLTKLWKTSSASPRDASEQPAVKKRRIQSEDDDRHDRPADADNGPSASTDAAVGPSKQDKPPTKRPPKSSRFRVEQPDRLRRLAGMDDVYGKLLRQTWHMLRPSGVDAQGHGRKTTGIVLSGPSGIGKRTLVHNLAASNRVPLVSLDACFEDAERMERSLSEAFDAAISLSPSIIFLDDIDQSMSAHGSSKHGEHHLRAVRIFKQQMERIAKSSQKRGHVLAMATTSKLADVDPDLLAYGLFEESVPLRVPDCAARRDILEAVTEGSPLSEDVDLTEIAKLTHGYVGADLAAITKLAWARAMEREHGADCPFDTTADIHAMLRRHLQAPDLTVFPNLDSHQDGALKALAITMDDLKAATQLFTPSLRKQGFTAIPSVTWDQVGAMEVARKQLQMSIIGPIKNPELYQKFGLTKPAGVVLYGPPGCGKTLVAQAVAREAQASFILINGPELLNKYVGESERAVRELFQRARSSRPCILFFDEIDSIVPPRSSSSTESGARVVNALLTELDGAQDRSGIYVIGTTNRVDMIDEAMLRPGRLSVQVLVDLPTPAERVEILRAIYRTNHSEVTEEALRSLAAVALDARCTNFSGADLNGLHTKAAEHAVERWLATGSEPPLVTQADWDHALDNTYASVKNPASYGSLALPEQQRRKR